MLSALAPGYAQLPFSIERGKDCWVFDDQGNKFLDLYGGHAVCILGHSPKALQAALSEQAAQLSFYSNVAKVAVREAAARKLLEFSKTNLSSVFFCNSGAEANEQALKLALELSGRRKVAAFSGGFHGRSLLASLTTDAPKWHEPYPEFKERVTRLTPNDLTSLELLDKDTAVVIVEPIQSIAGVIEFTQSYLTALRKRTQELGILLLFDEVQTGVGRLGVPCVSAEVQPDMFTLAKSLAAGMPVGALVLSTAISEQLSIGDLGSTFGGGPLAMAALIATLSTIEEQNLMDSAQQFERQIRNELTHPKLLEVRGRGCLLGLQFSIASKHVQEALLKRGIITGTSSDSHVLRLLPPLSVPRAEIQTFCQTLCSILDEVDD